jgi:hypothetical protein
VHSTYSTLIPLWSICPVCESVSATCLSSTCLSSMSKLIMIVVGCKKIPSRWQSEPAGFLRSLLHDQVYIVKTSGSPLAVAESSSKVSIFHFTYCYLYFLYDTFVYSSPQRSGAFIEIHRCGLHIVYCRNKKRNLIWSWKHFFTPLLQTTERQTELWNHSTFIYEWKENDPIENGRRRPFACGIQEIYKSHVDLCVKDREAFWSLTSCL